REPGAVDHRCCSHRSQPMRMDSPPGLRLVRPVLLQAQVKECLPSKTQQLSGWQKALKWGRRRTRANLKSTGSMTRVSLALLGPESSYSFQKAFEFLRSPTLAADCQYKLRGE